MNFHGRFFAVNAHKSQSAEVESLRKSLAEERIALIKTAAKVPSLANTWLDVLSSRRGSTKVLPLREFAKVLKAKDLKDEDVLGYLEEQGEIIWVGDTVFLDPSWFGEKILGNALQMRREEMKALFPLASVSFEQVEMALDKLHLWEREERPDHIVEGEGEVGDCFGVRFLCKKKDKFP